MSAGGPFRPIVAVQQYVRSWRKSRHGADIANRSSLTQRRHDEDAEHTHTLWTERRNPCALRESAANRQERLHFTGEFRPGGLLRKYKMIVAFEGYQSSPWY